MDPEPASVSKHFSLFETSSKSSYKGDMQETEDEDPFSLSGSSSVLLGLAIAIATLCIPFAVVLTDRPLSPDKETSKLLKSNGSQTLSPFSFSRTGKSRS